MCSYIQDLFQRITKLTNMKKVVLVLIINSWLFLCSWPLTIHSEMWWYKEEMRNGNSGTERQAQSRMGGKYLYFLIIKEVYYRKALSKIFFVDSYLRLRDFSASVIFNSTRCELICLIRRMQLYFIRILKLVCVCLIQFLQWSNSSCFTFLLDLNHF